MRSVVAIVAAVSFALVALPADAKSDDQLFPARTSGPPGTVVTLPGPIECSGQPRLVLFLDTPGAAPADLSAGVPVDLSAGSVTIPNAEPGQHQVIVTCGSEIGAYFFFDVEPAFVAARHVAFAECASARNPRFGQGDGLPPKGATDRAHVEQTLRRGRKTLKKQFPEIIGLRIAPRNGQVWSRDANGHVVVEQLHDYWIEARVASVRDCPTSPSSWGDVPLEFFAPQPLPTIGAHLTGTLTDGRPYSIRVSKHQGLCVLIGDLDFGCDSSRTPRHEQPGRWWIAVENNAHPPPQSGVLLYGVLPADTTTIEFVYDDGHTSRSVANLDLQTRLWAAPISPGDNPATLIYRSANGSEVSHADMH